MSKHELVDAYVSGAINRRTFVHGLTALGVTGGLAAAYAVALEPATAKRKGNGKDFYDDLYGRPDSKADCRNGGFEKFGFRNQGQCIAFVSRRKDKKDKKGKKGKKR